MTGAPILPRCDATDQTWCPVCTEPTDEYSVEAFEILDLWCCPSCGQDALEHEQAIADEVADRRRDNPLEPDFRRLGQ